MNFAELVEVVSWSLWVAVGIVVALVASGFVGGQRRLGYNLFVGVAASVLGGWCSSVIGGDMTKGQLIVTVLSSMFFSILCVYILNSVLRRRR